MKLISRLLALAMLLTLNSCSLLEDLLPGQSSPTPYAVPQFTFTPTHIDSTATATSTATQLPPPIDIPIITEILSTLHLRLEFTSTSDWTTLEFMNPESIFTARLRALIGEPANPYAGVERLSFGQHIDGPEEAQEVGMVVDMLLEPVAIGQTFTLKLEKGNWNSSTIRLYAVHEGQADLLRTVEHAGVVADSGGLNTVFVRLDFASMPDLTLTSAEVQCYDMPKMIWAFYYPWYRLDDWNSAMLVDHPAQRYASHDPDSIARHIEQAQSAGIDGFISSWWGPDDYTDRNLKTLLDLAQERGFAVTVYFETLTGDGPLPRSEITRWLRYLIRTYREHPAFYKVNGKPLVVLWASDTVPDATWRGVFEDLRAEGLEAFTLGIGYSATNLDVFDGIHQYGIFLYDDLGQVFQAASRMTRTYPLLADDPQPKLWAATVQPGYDDRLIPGREGLFQDRQGGDFYRSAFEAALASDPDWIFITTWNEWWEHTHIEPSENFGELYLDITGEYARAWKGE